MGRRKTTKLDSKSLSKIITDGVHDIKNPLASVSILVQLLKRERDNSNGKLSSYIDKIDHHVNRVVLLVGMLSDFSRIYFDTLNLHPEIFSVKSFLEELAENYKNVSVQNMVDAEIVADKSRLRYCFKLLFSVVSSEPIQIATKKSSHNVAFIISPLKVDMNTNSIEDWKNLGGGGFAFPIISGIIEKQNGSLTLTQKNSTQILSLKLPVAQYE